MKSTASLADVKHRRNTGGASRIQHDGRERVFPSGTLEIVVNLHADEVRIHDPFDSRRFACYSSKVLIDDPGGNSIELHQPPAWIPPDG